LVSVWLVRGLAPITIAPACEQFAARLHCLLVNPVQSEPMNRDAPVRIWSSAHQTDAGACGQTTEDTIMHQPKAIRRRARAIAIAATTPATAPLEALTGAVLLALAAALLLHVF
jgi:hypothetical protein